MARRSDRYDQTGVSAAILMSFAFIGIASIILSIAAIAVASSANNSNANSNPSFLNISEIFESPFEPDLVDTNQRNVTMKLTRIGNDITISVSYWTGTVTPNGSPPYAPGMTTVLPIPEDYRSVNLTSNDFISSPFSACFTSTNTSTHAGSAYVNADGTVRFMVDMNNILNSWNGTSEIFPCVLYYERKSIISSS